MQIGDKVTSKLYAEKGTGTILGFTELFGESYVELLFSDGEKTSTSINDIIFVNTLASRLEDCNLEEPHAFMAKNMALRLKVNLSANKIVTSTNYKIQPLPHQLLAVHFVMDRFQPRSLIADEVGLGKTIEAILLYQEYKLRKMVKKVLIIAPSGLVLQWHEELLSKFDEQFVIYNREYIRTLKQSYGEETNVWTLNDKIIVSLDSVKPQKITNDLEHREQVRRQWHNHHIFEDMASAGFDMVIFDEAHKLSKRGDGSESARYKVGKLLSEAIPVFILLTATPHQGDEHLFVNLLRLVDPVLFADKKILSPALVQEVTVRNQKRAVVDFDGNRIFKHRITSLIEIERTEKENTDELELYRLVTEYTGKYYNLARRTNNQFLILLMILYQRIASSSSFALLQTMRRRKAFLEHDERQLDELETIISDNDEVQDDDLLFQQIADNKEDMAAENVFVDKCIKLTQKITTTFADAKFRKLIEVVDEIKNREDQIDLKFIIFTEFRATQSAIIEFLKKFGYSCSYINGSLSREERIDQVELFRNENQIMVSTDAGGEGINLQFCHCMINFDLPWNPSRLEQRIGRIDRIGQKYNALIFNFHLTDTVEDRVRRILETKLERIKDQFGDDKYTDVLNLLQDDFSFDRIYIDAIQVKEAESKKLNKIADQIFNRAKQIMDKDELLLPFSDFGGNAEEYLNSEVNKIIENLVMNYLKTNQVEVNRYKGEEDLCYFNNPFPDLSTGPITYRNVTFENSNSYKTGKIEFINIDHPLVNNVIRQLDNSASLGAVSAFRLQLNKFSGVSGVWFIYRLEIRNNVDREKTALVTVFMEDADFCNNRISNYLESKMTFDAQIIQNFNCEIDITAFTKGALIEAQEKAGDVFTATKLAWLEETNEYARKTEDYHTFKKNGIQNIRVDNIRESKLISLEKEKERSDAGLLLKRNIIPKLELYQMAFVEFI